MNEMHREIPGAARNEFKPTLKVVKRAERAEEEAKKENITVSSNALKKFATELWGEVGRKRSDRNPEAEKTRQSEARSEAKNLFQKIDREQ